MKHGGKKRFKTRDWVSGGTTLIDLACVRWSPEEEDIGSEKILMKNWWIYFKFN